MAVTLSQSGFTLGEVLGEKQVKFHLLHQNHGAFPKTVRRRGEPKLFPP